MTDPAADPLRDAILDLLARRDPGKTICPSDAARAVAGEADFRPWMDDARAAAARLVAEGRIVVTQRGETVDLATARGPIRLRLVDPDGDPNPDGDPGPGPGPDPGDGDPGPDQ